MANIHSKTSTISYKKKIFFNKYYERDAYGFSNIIISIILISQKLDELKQIQYVIRQRF